MRALRFLLLASFLITASVAEAGPRSGSSFGGLSGFRSSSGRSSGSGSLSRSYSGNRGSSGTGSSFIFLPSFGWGYGGFGYGGGMGLMGSLLVIGVVGLGAIMVVRSIRRASRRGALTTYGSGQDEYDEVAESVDRCYVYKVQLGIGRSGRGIQKRLEEFASTGDTSTETGLADLLRQTALELMREKDSIRYGQAEPSGPFSLTNGEAKLNGSAMAERSRFQVERVRGAGGQVRRSEATASVGSEALEFIVVTVLAATRQPFGGLQKLEDRSSLDALLGELGSVPAPALLGLEVVWTPADPEDSLTETDLMTTYPEMRSM
jgi:uncharacterized membrane protein